MVCFFFFLCLFEIFFFCNEIKIDNFKHIKLPLLVSEYKQ